MLNLTPWLSLLLLLTSTQVMAQPSSAQSIFKDSQSSVVQIQVIDNTSGKRTSIGSGFQITEEGVLATNYHVIAEAVISPEQYQVDVTLTDKSKHRVSVIDIDIIHDLALVKGEHLPKQALALQQNTPAMGEKLYAMGNPHDIGKTIVEGTYNGLIKQSLYQKIHFSGSLNSGMSGGPTLGADGQVIGINVATSGNQISFLVPVNHLQSLLHKSAQRHFAAHKDWLKEIEHQLVENQQHIINTLQTSNWPQGRLGQLMIPGELTPAFKCWSKTITPEEMNKPYALTSLQCGITDRIFIQGGFFTGSLSNTNVWLDSKSHNSMALYLRLSKMIDSLADFKNAKERDVVNFTCRNDFINIAKHDFKINYCHRPYKSFPNIGDHFVILNSVSEKYEGYILSWHLTGFSQNGLYQFLEKYLESIQWPISS